MNPADPASPELVARDFQVSRQDLARTRCVEGPSPDAASLRSGEVLLAVDKFAFSSSNLGYARGTGAALYLSFFAAEEGWGRLPVWGYAEVAASRHPLVREGERLFAYLPMSTHLRLPAGGNDAAGFADVSPHRARLPPAYNRILRVLRDPGYFPARENEQALLRPQFATSFLLDEHIAEQNFYGAERVLISSASSKTAQALGFLLRRRRRVRVIGLTSAANTGYCERSGCFDAVLAYDGLATLPLAGKAVYVDLGGRCTATIHHRLAGQLRASLRVVAAGAGSTPVQDLPGPAPEPFMALHRLRERQQQWGLEGYEERHAEAWRAFALSLSGWLRIQHQRGEAAVAQVYQEALEGRTPPEVGHILSL
ncbi:MAG: DUF2855 family protein [Stagnimonas sp.]|nr:DUF2855 family protein [Stagnimonas sp.]